MTTERDQALRTLTEAWLGLRRVAPEGDIVIERDEVLLAATSDALRGMTPNVRASLFAPVDELRIAEQHRNASLAIIPAASILSMHGDAEFMPVDALGPAIQILFEALKETASK